MYLSWTRSLEQQKQVFQGCCCSVLTLAVTMANYIDDIVRFGLKAEDWQPTIPVVAISNITSSKLATLAEGTSLFPEIWTDSAHGSKSQKVSVMMDLSTRREKLPTANVLGTLYGSEEPDLELLIGASLSTSSSNGLQSSPLDLVSIASLLELARTMSHVHHTQGWTPRRTVKFALWDRSSGMDTGLARYIQNNKHILGQEAVAYIDLDLAEDRDVRRLDSSVGLMDLLRIIADMVPDPVEPEFSLVEKWPSYFSQQYNRQPLGNYVINMANMSPLASTIGIPSISIQSLQILLSREANVNDPYISAITRVMSLVGVRIIDDIVLPYNLSAFVNFIDLRVRNTLTLADKSLPEEEFLKKNDNVLQALEKLQQAVNNLPAYDLCLVLTHLNNVKMKMESLFTDWRQTVVKGSTHTSVLSTVAEAVDLYKLTGNTDYYHKAQSEITSRLSEAMKLIQTVPAS
ncbi:uncharacterized protein LOC128218941 [Mya arenaria]|uniref:uncharacterized protein LOC128218941 n=1 Tax=Mya arenaria TaxID=6604 RepID=UPI0022E486EC|nr:uncharacterized protein LOC128218941 [Mya arenaria]